jgi:2-C-methyl-D-erythritol 4-phosphate cytidylyltransferase
VTGIIVAAGQGKRLAGPTLKQFLPVRGRPMLAHTIQVFEDCEVVDSIVVVVPPGNLKYCRDEIVAEFGFRKVTACVEGGNTRQESVYSGLLKTTEGIICVHDGVRPAVTCRLITECVESARISGGAIAAVPVRDTIKRVNRSEVVATLDRRELWEAQTPQVFRRELLMRAFEKAREEDYWGTDESSLVERLGVKVYVIMGSPANLKVTTPEDLAIIDGFMKMEA